MLPSTIDSSRSDALDMSTSEESALQHVVTPPLPRVMPTAQAAATAAAQLEQLSLAEDESFSAVLPALVANEAAMRVIGALQLEELDTRGETARLSPETVQAMRDVLLVGGAARGLARLAVVSRDSRACCAASPLRAAPDFSVTPRRDDIMRSIVEYVSSIPANEAASMLSVCGDDATRVLRLLANWPPPATMNGLSAADVKLRDLAVKWLAPASQTRRDRSNFDMAATLTTRFGTPLHELNYIFSAPSDEQEHRHSETQEPALRGRQRIKEGKFLLHLPLLDRAARSIRTN